MLENSKGDLCKCWDAMNDNIILRIGNIRASFQKSFYYTERMHNGPFFQNLRGFVSRAAMTHIVKELKRCAYVETNKDICGCTLRSTCGLPCACELSGYKLTGVPIPLDSIHVHWKKLTMEGPMEDDTEDGYELDMTEATDALWRRFQSLDIIGKRALKSKVCELAYPATTSMCAPPEKMKTKGGVKKGKSKAPKGYDVYRDPSYFEHVDKEYEDSQGSSKRVRTQQSQPSQPSSSQKQPSQKQPYQPSSSQKQPSQKQLSHKQPTKKYLEQFPKSIHPYIVDIVDVEPDGNCGFRAIASLLGYTVDGWPIVRRELDNELRNNISLYEKLFGEGLKVVRDSLLMSDGWFTIPAMGYLVANRYNVILVTLGKPSTTFCPMMTSHSSSSRFFCIGFVNGNHWVQVNSNFKLF
jgi:alpha-glucosidase